MVASLIAYGMSASMLVLVAGCVYTAFSEEERRKVEPISLMLLFVVFGFLAWLFAYAGGL